MADMTDRPLTPDTLSAEQMLNRVLDYVAGTTGGANRPMTQQATAADYLHRLIARERAALAARVAAPSDGLREVSNALREAIDYMPANTVSEKARRDRWERALAATEQPETDE